MQDRAITPAPTGHISAERAGRMTAWWPVSLSSQVSNRTDRDQIEAGIKQLLVPCDQAWLMARVLALLLPDFAADVPESVRRIEAGDWASALYQRPQWAIEKACRWWRGEDNADRRKRPMIGDIEERVKFELGILSFGAMKIREFDKGFQDRMKAPEDAPPTPEEMAHRRAFAQGVMAKAGYATQRANPGPRRETVTDEDRAEMAVMLGAAK